MLPDDIPTEVTKLVYTAPPLNEHNRVFLSQNEAAAQLAHYWPAIEAHIRERVAAEIEGAIRTWEITAYSVFVPPAAMDALRAALAVAGPLRDAQEAADLAADEETDSHDGEATGRDRLAQETAEYIASQPGVAVFHSDDRWPPTDVPGIKADLLDGRFWPSWMDDRVTAAMRALHSELTGDDGPHSDAMYAEQHDGTPVDDDPDID